MKYIPETKEDFLEYESESVDSTLLKAIGLLLLRLIEQQENTNVLLSMLVDKIVRNM